MTLWYTMKLAAQWRHTVLVQMTCGHDEWLRDVSLRQHLAFVDLVYGGRGDLKPLWCYS